MVPLHSSFEIQSFLTIILGFVAILLSLYQIRNKIIKFICTGFVVLLSLALFIVSLNVHKEQDMKFDELANEVRADLANKNLSTKKIIEKLKQAYQNIMEASADEAKAWADKFAKSLPERKAEHKSILSSEQELAQKLELKWKPLYDYILTIFDNVILQLQKNNMVVNYEKPEADQLIQIDNDNPQLKYVRIVTFPNNRTIQIRVRPAIIQRGKFHVPLQINVIEGNALTPLLVITFHEDSFGLYNPNGNSHDTTKDPLLDQEFRTLLTIGVFNSVEYVYIEEPIKH